MCLTSHLCFFQPAILTIYSSWWILWHLFLNCGPCHTPCHTTFCTKDFLQVASKSYMEFSNNGDIPCAWPTTITISTPPNEVSSRYITMYIGYCLGLLCNMSYRIRRGAILRDMGCGPKWIICITRCSFQRDSKSGGLKLAPFLIRQKNAKYLQKATGRKFELLHFG